MAKTVNLAEVVPGYESGVKEFIVEDKQKGKVEVMTRENLERMAPENIGTVTPKPFQGNIIDGADDIAEYYLHKEFPYLLQFFRELGIDQPMITYDFETPGEHWVKMDFPLPEKTTLEDGSTYRFPYDKESFLFILNNYPDSPPIGFHIPKGSQNIGAMEKIFGTHLYDHAILESDHVESSLKNNWHWICFHYNDNSWNFNRNNIKEGDTLAYYCYYIYYKLLGVEGVSQ
ncbi:hypothetical protein ACM66Z_07115 [Sulfurovum sp. ST-21]|uniref:Uncharacterized protein n=1 Tax=Sulfurovum indicum TaxID=2779528 RepID=A0A7M1S2C8_9BACT|nr:hypothetical protein [Sulfurovum indicum]QOR61222.1 hypothetical protein IMZ28_07110 [Sulfurovum indicum]